MKNNRNIVQSVNDHSSDEDFEDFGDTDECLVSH